MEVNADDDLLRLEESSHFENEIFFAALLLICFSCLFQSIIYTILLAFTAFHGHQNICMIKVTIRC